MSNIFFSATKIYNINVLQYKIAILIHFLPALRSGYKSNFCFLTFPPNFAKLGDPLVLLVGLVGPYHKALNRADRKDSDINIQITT